MGSAIDRDEFVREAVAAPRDWVKLPVWEAFCAATLSPSYRPGVETAPILAAETAAESTCKPCKSQACAESCEA